MINTFSNASRRRVVAVAATLGIVWASVVASPAVGQNGPRYRPPVEGVIIDRFRPPTRSYGPANLGIDYHTEPGASVVSSRAGTVLFAGGVGGEVFVIIAHDDGLRTTYGFLAEAIVERGALVHAGQVVGTSTGHVHFGVRRDRTYLDPERVLRGARLRARLVPNS